MPAHLRKNGNTAIIDLEGRLSIGDPVEDFRKLWMEALEQGVKNIVVNLGEVTMMDSSGIGTMIRCHSAVTQQGGKLRLVNPNSVVRQITRLDSVFEFHESEQSALAASAS
jgi:anti-anti-sigma factor